MKKYSILISVVCSLLFSSCDNFLDIQPKGIVIPQNYEDYEKLLNYGQLLKASASYPCFMTDDIQLPDGLDISEEQLIEIPTKNLFTFQSEIYGDAETDDLWEYSYNRIYYYNVVIEDIMAVGDASLADKRALRAEALMGRAFEYLTLVNAYGNHYDKSTAATDPGVPLMLDKQINKTGLTRATVQQVYNRIKEDLDTAALYLPQKPAGTAYRASKPVGLGMLARMYLYMGDYNKAKSYAEQSLAVNNTLLDIKQFKVVDPEKSIGRINYPSDCKNNPESIYIRLAPWTFGFSGTAFGSDEFVALFSGDDVRKELFLTTYFYGTTYPCYVWAPYVYANMAMSVPEMFLIAAECEARVGSKDKAMEYINTLMDKRIRNFTPQVASTNDEALVKVLNERRRELAMLGCTRLIDLKRLNRESRFAKTITHTTEGQTYTLEPNSPKYILPIPPKVLSFNPAMQPNVR